MPPDAIVAVGAAFVVLKVVSTVTGVWMRKRQRDSGTFFEIVWWLSKTTPAGFALSVLAYGYLAKSVLYEEVGWALVVLTAVLLALVFLRKDRTPLIRLH